MEESLSQPPQLSFFSKLKSRKFAIPLAVVVAVVIGLAGWRVFSTHSPSGSSVMTLSNSSTQFPAVAGKIDKIDTSKLKFDQAAMKNDPLGDPNGPFYHSVYTATSTNGQQFTPTGNKIADHTSVPDVIKLPSGQLVFYAVDGAQSSKSGVLLGVSDDNGKTWKLGSMQLNVGKGGVADPQITMTDSGQLRLYYTIFSGPPVSGQPAATVNKIDSAISTDGINFTQEPGDRFEYAQITDPDVIKIGATWFMYVAQGPTLLYATSTAGNGSFSYQGVTRQRGSVSKTVALGGGKYRQFYCLNGISSSVTSDGINWTDEGLSLVAPAGKIICDPSPAQIGPNSWLMVYKQVN